jgi:hypothetical protein
VRGRPRRFGKRISTSIIIKKVKKLMCCVTFKMPKIKMMCSEPVLCLLKLQKFRKEAVLWLRWLVDSLLPQRPWFMPRSVHVRYVMDKVSLGQIFLQVLRFPFVNIIPPWHSILISSGG